MDEYKLGAWNVSSTARLRHIIQFSYNLNKSACHLYYITGNEAKHNLISPRLATLYFTTNIFFVFLLNMHYYKYYEKHIILKKNKSATTIQNAIRGHNARNETKKQRNNVID